MTSANMQQFDLRVVWSLCPFIVYSCLSSVWMWRYVGFIPAQNGQEARVHLGQVSGPSQGCLPAHR